ncbi:8208_t:CDS:2 [Funneliformis geosporum]|uniref:8208_t:CDS:1 n=1 Tax=Funneliformis geosporum TaxID=1117311 RepID=A0A9W4WUX9_9GLOM|nr:8208_t:CDS:2 [Funneliformis geosporum]
MKSECVFVKSKRVRLVNTSPRLLSPPTKHVFRFRFRPCPPTKHALHVFSASTSHPPTKHVLHVFFRLLLEPPRSTYRNIRNVSRLHNTYETQKNVSRPIPPTKTQGVFLGFADRNLYYCQSTRLSKWLKRNLKDNVKETLEATIEHLIKLKPPKCNSKALKSSLRDLMKNDEAIRKECEALNMWLTADVPEKVENKRLKVVDKDNRAVFKKESGSPTNNKESQKSEEVQAVPTNNKESQESDEEQAVSTNDKESQEIDIRSWREVNKEEGEILIYPSFSRIPQSTHSRQLSKVRMLNQH